MIDTLQLNLGLLVSAATVLWLVSLLLRNASIVDPCWGLGFVLVAWTCLAKTEVADARAWLLVVLVTIWGVRLAAYLTWRNWGAGEDPRYTQMRNYHGQSFWWRSLGTVFLLQALILGFVSLPVQLAVLRSASRLGLVDLAGVLLWCVGMFFESVGDFQLARFRAQPENRGQVLATGLWRFTRHPNYFGDFCVWWGIYFVAVGGGAAGTLLSPLLMSVLLLYVSGVRLTEQTIEDRRPAYREYRRRTSAFFPRLPRHP